MLILADLLMTPEPVIFYQTSLFVFLFGLAVGSFLNVVVYRLNHHKNPLKGRSFCPKCKHQLSWLDNMPLLSFLLLKGRCRYCRSPISWQYPLVELATALLSLLVFNWSRENTATTLGLFYYLFITYSLITIFVSDFLYQTIPDEVSVPAIIAGFLWALGQQNLSFVITGAAAALFFYLLYFFTKGKGMAFGDVKLALLMGLFLGWPKIIIALYLAFLTGAVVGLGLILFKKKKFGQTIAFGPFLTASTLASLFWGESIFAFYQLLI